MSEPWNVEEKTSSKDNSDRIARFILFGGLALSLTSLVVGTVVKPIVERLRRFNMGANKDEE